MEIMVVVVIIALVSTGAVLGLGASDKAKLRSATWSMVSASKYAYARAVSRGTTVRIVLDFEQRTIQLQETDQPVVLNRSDATGVGLNREDSLDEYLPDGSVVEGEKGVGLRQIGPEILGQSVSDGTGQEDMGVPVTDSFLKALTGQHSGDLPRYRGPRFEVLSGNQGKPVTLKGNVGFARVFSPHAPEVIEEGFAFIYYFPGGMTEHTYIQISDFDADRPDVKTVVIHPLTGQAVIHHEELEPEVDLDNLQEAN